MQLHTTADGQEHEMSVVSYPTWSASSSHEQRADPSADGKYNHWWPSQAYHCTFCPRVFRTAQALGGHMNIHRRERAFANDTGTHHFHTRRGDSTQASNSVLSRSSSHPAATLDQLRSSLFSSTPPAPCPVSYKENCYANRRIAVTPDSATHLVTTANFFAPIQAADMTYHHRVGWNHGGDAAAKLEESSGHNTSDPLSWLFSQLPPPCSVSTLQQRQQSQPQQNQNQQQQQQCRGGNILTQKNLAKPYHRAVAVRRSGGHPSPPFSEQDLQARGRWEAGGSRNGEQEDGDEDLDLELRL